jgi:hypothetical protein
MLPAALELLMRRLQARDRKHMISGAMVSAELWNIAFSSSPEAREKHPEAFTAHDFLPELPEERRRREKEYARAQALAALPPSAEELSLYKERLMQGVPRKPSY